MSIEMCNLSSNIFNSGKPWEGFWGQMRCAHSCGILGWTTGSHCWRWNPPGQSTAQSLCPGAPWSEMWHLDVPSLRCTNHRKLLCSDETTFWILKQAHFFFKFTFTANPCLLKGGQLHVEFYCLCCDLVKRFRSKHVGIYLKNVHTLQQDGACKSQHLCNALNKSSREWEQVFLWLCLHYSTAHLNSGWMGNPFVQWVIRMQSWKNKHWYK